MEQIKKYVWIIVLEEKGKITIHRRSFPEREFTCHELFDNYWEAYAIKCKIDQGLIQPVARLRDPERWRF